VRDHLKCIPAALLVLFGLSLLTASVCVQEGEATTFVYTGDDNDGPNTDSLIHYNFAGFKPAHKEEKHGGNSILV